MNGIYVELDDARINAYRQTALTLTPTPTASIHFITIMLMRARIASDDLIWIDRNQGGFDMIGSGRHKIESPEQFASSAQHCKDMALDGLVVIGGRYSYYHQP